MRLFRSILLIFFLLGLPFLALAQSMRQVSLQITIVMDGESQPTDRELTIALMDEWSAIEAVQTTNRGMVSFLTKAGVHRIRIVGTDIEQFDTEFAIEGNSQGTMTFVVTPRFTQLSQRTSDRPIAAIRLKIPGKAKKEMRKGEKAMQKERWVEARLHLEKAIAIYPEYDLAYQALAKLALAVGNKESARKHLQKALQLNDAFPEANRDLAAILMSESRYAEAEPLLRKSLESDPMNLWALTAIALAELTIGKVQQAIAHAQKVHTTSHEGYASAHLVAARALEAVQQPAEALGEYRLYLAEDATGPNVAIAQAAIVRLAGAGSPNNK
jgi:tetratricopeptide (TPR) repeat protein